MSTKAGRPVAGRFACSLVTIWILVACFIVCTCLAAVPLAQADEPIRFEPEKEHVSLDKTQIGNLPSSEKLFAGYVEKTFLGDSEESIFGDYGEEIFDGGSLAIYRALKSMCGDVAQGVSSTTSFDIDYGKWGATTTLSVAEYGKDIVVDGAISPSAVSALVAKTLGDHSFTEIVECLLYDCPYALYWFDKTVGYSYSLGGCSYDPVTKVLAWDTDASCDMYVEAAYSATGKADTLAVDTAKTGATKTAVNNALAIVASNAGKGDYQKLLAYKNAICDLTDYDFSAASNANTPYGDPWQLIYVFDGDPNTKVVCEGYAKAFQLLCDKSSFGPSCTGCITVTGTIDGGGHMWNNVMMDDVAYLVDVTNCDTGSVGYPSALFLAGALGDIWDGYSFEMKDGETVSYKYDSETLEIYESSQEGMGMLALARANFVPITVDVLNSPAAVSYGYSKPPVLTASAQIGSEVKGDSLKYQWYMAKPGKDFAAMANATSSTYKLPLGLDAGMYQVYCEVSLVDSGTVVGSRLTTKASVQVNSAQISKVSGLSVTVSDKTYTGRALKPAPVIKAGKKKLVKEKDYTVSFANNVNVGKAKLIITGMGNYQGTMTKSFKVLPKNTKIKKLVAGSKSITVKWIKLKAKMGKSRVTGYQVRYSTKASMKSAKRTKLLKNYNKASLKVTKLKAKRKYYVQVRTYMKVGGKVYYSAWSPKKAVKTR